MRPEENDLIRMLIANTDKDVIPWEKLDDSGERFGSFDERFPFVVDGTNDVPVLLTNTVVESLLSRSMPVKDLLEAVKKQMARNGLDAEFSELLAQYLRP